MITRLMRAIQHLLLKEIHIASRKSLTGPKLLIFLEHSLAGLLSLSKTHQTGVGLNLFHLKAMAKLTIKSLLAAM